MDAVLPHNIKGYEVRERIGAGGFGAVYRAYQTTVGREVAIKLILPGLANQPDFIRRFEGEAQLVARLEHPHIVPLHDYWRDPDGAYLVMRWLRGGSLREALQHGAFELRAAALLLDQLASALSLAHRSNIIHRDIKPANILLDEDGNAYLTDFGIAKDLALNENGTQSDAIIGSLDYISPEQARGETVTTRTDIYSLGVTMYEVITRQHPFRNATAVEILYRHINDPLPQITTFPASISAEVNRVIQKATAKNPAQRYPDALAFAADFREAAGLNRTPTSVVEQLTQREQEILTLISEGLSNKEIAQRLTIALSTVKWYANQIFSKLGVRSRVQAMVRARELNLLTLPTEQAPVPVQPTGDFQLENPYKGLRAFQPADNGDFFGREKITARLASRLGENDRLARFLAVVGPSGSGKSSLVRAGLIPALWRGDLKGSEKWFVVEMLPGARPLDELEIALTKVAANQASNLRDQLQRDQYGLLRVASLILPDDGSDLVLIVDQFEELFTLTQDEAARAHFLELLYTAVTEPRSRVRVVVTLRADFYDRPLLYPRFGELVQGRLETILPLSADELERAIARPAERVGVTFEPGLVSIIVADVNYQPGALPLLQYALTELFERRAGRQLTHEAYTAIGEAIGALAKRAEMLYLAQDEAGRETVRQLFLRLVTLGEGTEDTRRRTPRSELLAVAAESDLVEEIIDSYTAYRLFSLDTDPGTHSPTVEVAHEALLREWERLRGWLNESRTEIRLQRQLAAMAAEWRRANRDASYLARGTRLDQFEVWAAETQLALTPAERDYLNASAAERERQAVAERERQARETRLERRSRDFLRGLVAVFALATVVAVGLTLFAFDQEGQAQIARAASEENAAESRQSALLSGAQAALLTDNTDLALALALEANRSDHASSQARVMLAQAAYAPGTIRRIEYAESINDVAFSPDGHLVASASADDTVHLWNVETGEEMHELSAHYDDVSAIAFSPDGRTLLSASGDTSLILWNVDTGEQIRRFWGHSDWIDSVAFSPDGHTALSGDDSGTIILWDVATGEEIRRFSGHLFWVTTVVFHPDGLRALSGSWDGTLRLWDLQTGETLQTYDPGVSQINRAAFRPDGRTFVMTSGETADVLVLDTETGVVLRRMKGHDGTTISLALDPNGRFALSGAWDGIMILWDLETGEMLHRYLGHTHGIMGVAFSPDGRYALSGSLDATVREWDLYGGQVVRRFQPQIGQPLQWIVQVRFSPDGQTALTSSLDGVSVLWDVALGTEIRRFEGRNALFSEDGSTGIFGTGIWYNPSSVGSLNFVNLATGEQLHHIDFGSAVRDMALSPDGKSFTASFANALARSMDATTGDFIQNFGESGDTGVIAFSPDGTLLAGNVNQTDVAIWDVNAGYGIPAKVLQGHSAFLESITFSPDGTTLLTSSFDNSVILWDVATGNILHRFTDHSASAFESVFSPDGKLVLSGSADRSLIVWDIATGEMLRRFTGLRTGIYKVDFSPDRQRLLVGYVDGTVELWHIDTTEDLTVWTQAHRYIAELTCEQRTLYRLSPMCDDVMEPSARTA